MRIQEFYDPATFTLTFVVFDEKTRDAVVIDPVLDYDPSAAQTSTLSLGRVAAFAEREKLHVHYLLETHAHADHVSGAQELKERLGGKTAIGERIVEVQNTFRGIFDLGEQLAVNGSQFDKLLRDDEVFDAGSLSVRVIATPGHTPACVTFHIGDALFTGDALFIEDYGTGRCDFPAGSAADLYRSVHERLYAFPDETRVFVGHDYQPNDRPLRFETTIGASKRANVQLRAETTQEEFVRFREARDKTLAPPRLIFPSVQLNVNAGKPFPPHANGRSYLSIPLNLFRR